MGPDFRMRQLGRGQGWELGHVVSWPWNRACWELAGPWQL